MPFSWHAKIAGVFIAIARIRWVHLGPSLLIAHGGVELLKHGLRYLRYQTVYLCLLGCLVGIIFIKIQIFVKLNSVL